MDRQHRGWCFTLNNPSAEDERLLESLCRSVELTPEYLIVGSEIGVHGTPHLQGYVLLKRRVRGRTLKGAYLPRAHLERARGTPAQNKEYCSKQGSYWEHGICPATTKGARVDLLQLKRDIDSKIPPGDLWDRNFPACLKYQRGIEAYKSARIEKRTWKSDVYVFWGLTGSGKTRTVYESEDDLWIASDNQLSWFDGYSGQEAALFDDFTDVSMKKFGFFLRLLDRYPMQVPVKGGFVQWSPRRIYITSNLEPHAWCVQAPAASIAAMHRRFTEVKEFTTVENG